MRIMGLDFGTVTCGVAISDGLLLTAQPVETIRRKHANKLRQTYARIEELIASSEVGRIVVGLPVTLGGDEKERAAACREFAEGLERRTGLEVIMWDERLTTVEAHRILDEAGLDYEKKAEVVDKIAAAIILQNYLDSLSREDPGQPG
ncbi:MAG: Holliday junction resolvase RuvX [Lachnospiraceae bacterium]|nr:Holliday junction resolvase RuvX [Lachnospiraceae bacterium]